MAAAIVLSWVEGIEAKVPQACARALNRAITTTRAVMAREISQDVGLKVTTVKEQLKIEKATPDHLVARLSVTGKRIPLIEFGARGPEPSRGKGRGVTARIKGGAGRYPQAFIITVGKGGHRGVFVRKGELGLRKSRGAWSKNLPIRELKGPSLPKVFEKVSPAGLAAGEESLRKNLASELRFATGESGSPTPE